MLLATKVACLAGPVYGQHYYSMPLSDLRITSTFGKRIHPITKEVQQHYGLDLVAAYEPVYAVLSGQVERVGYHKDLGNFLELKQGSFLFQYAHLSLSLVAPGDEVSAGEIMAISGSSGKVTGPHLHFAVRFKKSWINPLYFLRDLSLSAKE